MAPGRTHAGAKEKHGKQGSGKNGNQQMLTPILLISGSDCEMGQYSAALSKARVETGKGQEESGVKLKQVKGDERCYL